MSRWVYSNMKRNSQTRPTLVSAITHLGPATQTGQFARNLGTPLRNARKRFPPLKDRVQAFRYTAQAAGMAGFSDGLPHCIGMPKAGSQAIQTVPAGFLRADPAVKRLPEGS